MSTESTAHHEAFNDYLGTYRLAKMVTFNSRERDRYLDWLYERMRAMARRRVFRNAVYSVAAVLMRRETVSARHVAVLTNRAIRAAQRRALDDRPHRRREGRRPRHRRPRDRCLGVAGRPCGLALPVHH
jgi:hypothetical protein